MWRMMKHIYDGMGEKCCDAGRGNIPIYLLIFYKEVHGGVLLSPQSIQGIY